MYWPFFFGGGGPIGSGRQYMSWLTLDDAVRIIEHAIKR
jgi:NAD dependent epimerase/dehydratase family enzyme